MIMKQTEELKRLLKYQTIMKLPPKGMKNIDGVKENQGTRRPKSIVTGLLKDLQVDYVDADIKSAYRLGPINDKATRPPSIKVLFASNRFKYDIFKNIKKLQGKEQWKGVHISDSVTIEEQERRWDMRCIYAAGKARGIDVKLKVSCIIIDGVKFNHNIHTLPKGLCISEVKILMTKDGVAFQSHHTYLSHMFPCKINFEGVEYKSSEHIYHTEMAKHHNHFDLVNRIIKAKDGYASKRIARVIIIADNLEEVKLKIMRNVINLKFDQHDGLRDKFLATI